MALKFQPLKVNRISRETTDAITIHFDCPDKELFTYKPGQYLTLRVNINGKNYNRAYSLCSSPTCDEHLAVTVKKVSSGIVSAYLNAHLKEGMTLEVFPPLGKFCAAPDPLHQNHYILIGAGSGITPLMSILRTALNSEPSSKVTLIYGNNREETIIFNEWLKQLEKEYPNQLKVIHSLSHPSTDWKGQTGRLTRGKVKEILATLDENDGLKREYYVCGPASMMDDTLHALKDLKVPVDQVHQEHFSAPITNPMEEEEEESDVIKDQEVTVILEGAEHVIKVTPVTTILEAALDNDLDPPYACMIGSCCTCKAKLLSGKIIMDDREGLTDEEIADGYVLTCQSHPTTSNVVVSYDE